MNDHNAQQVGPTIQSTPRSGLGNAFRGLLLVADVGMGGLMLFGGRLAIFGMDRAMLFVGLVLVVLGLWLVASGILVVIQKRPTCWTMGTWSHVAAGLGYFVLMAAANVVQLPPERDSGHPGAVELDLVAIFSFGCAALGIVWLIAAAVIFAFRIGERRNEKTVHFLSGIIEHSEGNS
jgi:hypothetical protein